ncbi:MAG: hypothetical protein WDW36_002268 [Sanguina aurantia]
MDIFEYSDGVVATSREACALLLGSFPQKQLLGSVSLPSSPLTELGITASLRDQTTHLYHVSPTSPLPSHNSPAPAPATPSASAGNLTLDRGWRVLELDTRTCVVPARCHKPPLPSTPRGAALIGGCHGHTVVRNRPCDASPAEHTAPRTPTAAHSHDTPPHLTPLSAGATPECKVCPAWPPAGLLLLVCQQTVPREETVGWARTVMGSLHADHVLLLGCIPADGYIGPGDPSQEPQVHLVNTSAAPTSSKPAPTALLPTGNVVGGLPAALLSHCQVRGISASLLLTVDSASNGGSAHTLQALARGIVAWAACAQTAVSDGQAFGLLHGALSSGSGLKAAITLLANHDCGAAVSATGVVFM